MGAENQFYAVLNKSDYDYDHGRGFRGIRQLLLLIYTATAGGFPRILARNGSKEHGINKQNIGILLTQAGHPALLGKAPTTCLER